MSTAATPAAPSLRPHRTWIVSPAWDLVYLVLTPLAIVPAVTIAADRWLTSEQLYLAVISFASLGHHLPGFMRAYGDRELFDRFRWRFLLAPPLAFALALVFTPPPIVARTFSLPWEHLHGLELILLLWGTWHGLMQTYGFMRIYDLRRGASDPTSARLDHALCVAMFGAGLVLSDHRMTGLAATMWEAGLPSFGPEAVAWLRGATIIACAVVGVAYAANLVRCWRRGESPNLVKLLLALSTGWFYWYCGRLSTNVLIGLAMFEIYHAVQYNAIVWVYNRRLMERAGQRFGPLAFMFRDRASMLCLYLAAIGAYSSIRFFTADSGDRMFGGDLLGAHQWLVAWFVASSILHFYYDGFIWKVSESSTRANLVDDGEPAPVKTNYVPALVHGMKWGALLLAAAALVAFERRSLSRGGNDREVEVAAALARLSPNDWEARLDLAATLEKAGKLREAEAAYRRAAELAPQQPAPRQALAGFLADSGRVAEAAPIYEALVRLQPESADAQYQLGLTRLKLGDAERAAAALHGAVELAPDHFLAHLQLGDALAALDKRAAAAEEYRTAIRLKPDVAAARVALAEVLLKSGAARAAAAAIRAGLARQPESAELNFTLGLILQQTGDAAEAARYFAAARKLGLDVGKATGE